MTISGRAFIVIWHDLEPGFENEFSRWHTEEHMPERLGVPGFLRGRRYMNPQQVPHVCFTLYEISHVAIFLSPSYLARLNTPTAWSHRIQPHMTNFLRGVCESVLSLGDGTGGAMASWRIGVTPGAAGPELLAGPVLQAFGVHGVTAVHLGRHEQSMAGTATAETALRPAPLDADFDFVLLVEAIDLETLAREGQRITALLRQVGALVSEPALYRLAYELLAPR